MHRTADSHWCRVRTHRSGTRPLALLVACGVLLSFVGAVQAAPPRRQLQRGRAAPSLFKSRRVGRRVQQAFPELVRRLGVEAKSWGRRGTRFQLGLDKRGRLHRDPVLNRIADRQGMLDEIIDVRSPKTVKVYRGLAQTSRRQFDPNYNLGLGRADCVAGHWSTALDYARGSRGKGLLVEYELPAKLLSYNRGEYIIDLDKLRAHGVDSLAPFVKRVGRVGPETHSRGIYRLSRVHGIQWRSALSPKGPGGRAAGRAVPSR